MTFSADGQPSPEDWITQKELCVLLGISQHTASAWAKAERLREFEHGIGTAGRRKYSRRLVALVLQASWDAALKLHNPQGRGRDKESQP